MRRRPGYRRLEVAVLGTAIWALLWLLRWTTRFHYEGLESVEADWTRGHPMVFAFWHGRAMMLPFLSRGREAYIMNSTHRDGEIVTRTLVRFGIKTTRGSSRRNAVSGTLGLLRALKRGAPVALIPDGPRGPAGIAKPGAVELALRTGVPLVPLAFSAKPAIRLGGWDRMLVPLPGAKVVCVAGEPIVTAGREPTKELREELRCQLEDALRDLCRRADRVVGRREEGQ